MVVLLKDIIKLEKERKLRKNITLLFIMSLIFMAGCGGGGNSNISSSIWYDVGISMPMNSTAARSCGINVDAFPTSCSDGQFISDHTTPVILTLTVIDPKVDPGSLFLEKYVITYVPLRPQSPIIPPLTVFSTQELKVGSNTITAIVMDMQRKEAFAALFNTGQISWDNQPVGYTVNYVFSGRNAYGQNWSFQSQATIFVGEFNECAACII